MTEHFDFVVSREELQCLRRVVADDVLLTWFSASIVQVPVPTVTVRLRRDDAERLREQLTRVLAEVGFDENYSPNQLGRLLETLIDKFYIPRCETFHTLLRLAPAVCGR